MTAPEVQPIPLVDLLRQHRQVAAEVAAGFDGILQSGAFVGGSDVVAFEQEFAAFCNVDHCIGVANGTDALELALRAVGIGSGDEVILPANTFVATAEAVIRCGAAPVLVDCDERHWLIDPAGVTAHLSKATRAIVPVHLYGQLAPMEDLTAIAADRGIAIVEDAAQAQGARRHGQTAGSWGIAAGTSFYPGKNLGAYGDAGAVLTSNAVVARTVRALRNHGGESPYEHELAGVNSRLDTLQAVVLRAKLRRLQEWNDQRVCAAEVYHRLLAGRPEVVRPETLAGNGHVWHLYVVRVPQRDRVLSALHGAGVAAGVHYPRPIHLHGGFRQLSAPGDHPVSERLAGEILSLPIFPGITRAEQERVVETLFAALDGAPSA